MEDRVARWKDAWESRDADRVLALALVPELLECRGCRIRAVRVLHL